MNISSVRSQSGKSSASAAARGHGETGARESLRQKSSDKLFRVFATDVSESFCVVLVYASDSGEAREKVAHGEYEEIEDYWDASHEFLTGDVEEVKA